MSMNIYDLTGSSNELSPAILPPRNNTIDLSNEQNIDKDENKENNTFNNNNNNNLSKKRKRTNNNSIQECPICFDKLTSSGNHRICAVKCGHLFGRSCIERWFQMEKKHNNKKKVRCPQCNCIIKLKDTINLYFSDINIEDTSRLEDISKKYLDEKNKKDLLVKRFQVGSTQYNLLLNELKKTNERYNILKKENMELLQRLQSYENITNNNNNITNNITNNNKFNLITKIPILNSSVFCFENRINSETLFYSFDNKSQNYQRYGIIQLSLLDPQIQQKYYIHNESIRDIKCKNNYLLTTSFDKKLCINDIRSKLSVHSYNLPGNGWSCEFSKNYDNDCQIYCGLHNGKILIYDIRVTNEIYDTINAPYEFQPIHSLSHIINLPNIQNIDQNNLNIILGGSIGGGWLLNLETKQYYTLPFHGNCTSVSYSRCRNIKDNFNNKFNILSSYRSNNNRVATHFFSSLNLLDNNIINNYKNNNINNNNNNQLIEYITNNFNEHLCITGHESKMNLSKSITYNTTDNKTYIISGNEKTCQPYIWEINENNNNGYIKEKLIPHKSPILDIDIMSVRSVKKDILASLSLNELFLYSQSY